MDKIAYAKNMIRAADYIEKNIKTKIRINALAKYAYMSEHHFWRVFKRLFREPVGEYIRKRRLTIMAEKLLNDGRDVSDICIEYGFDSVEVFWRGFKKQFGVTPAQYRKMNRAVTRYLRRERMTAGYIRHVLGGGISEKPVYKRYPEKLLSGLNTDIGRGGRIVQEFILAVTGMLSHLFLKSREGREKFIVVSGGRGGMIFSDTPYFSIFRGTAGASGNRTFRLKKGRHAVYLHRGPISNFFYSAEYIFMRNLPPDTAKKVPYVAAVFTKDNAMAKDFEMEFRVPVF